MSNTQRFVSHCLAEAMPHAAVRPARRLIVAGSRPSFAAAASNSFQVVSSTGMPVARRCVRISRSGSPATRTWSTPDCGGDA